MKDTGPYTIIARLGEGGMAEVYKAIKQGADGFEKPIALKRVLPHLADNPAFIKMLSAEARIMAMLDHPNIVHVSDFFSQDQTFFLALEYVSGKNLRNLLVEARKAGKPLSWKAVVHIVSETLKGLDYAHKKVGPHGPLRIVHRDISPQNILISNEGWVKLSDFGIAKANVTRDETKSGVVKGKLGYFSPELLKSHAIDCKSDLFSMGVLLYEAFTGIHPFRTDNEYETMNRIVEGVYKPLSRVCPELPQPILQAVERAMKTNPSERHADADELRTELCAGQDSHWLANGHSELSKLLKIYYPSGFAAEESPIEDTLVLSQTGTPIPVRIESPQSMMEPTDLKNKARITLWVLLLLGVLGASKFFYDRSQPEPSSVTPPPQPQETAVEPTQIESKVVKPKKSKKAPGKLQVKGIKGSTVFLNGQKVGVLPMKALSLAPGSYNLLIAVPGRPSQMMRVRVDSKRTNTVYQK